MTIPIDVLSKTPVNTPVETRTIYICYRKTTLSYFEDYIKSIIQLNPRMIKMIPFHRVTKLPLKNNDILIFIRYIPKDLLPFLAQKKHYLLNTEQLTRDSMVSSVFQDINKDTMILDYSKANIKLMSKIPKLTGRTIKYLPYQVNSKEIRSGLNGKKDLDVCIIDSPSPRRQTIINEIRKLPNSRVIAGFGKSRDEILFRHKILVNIHAATDFNVFEQIRCNRCILNKMIVISEPNIDESLKCDFELQDYMIICPYEEIMNKVNEVLKNYDFFYHKLFDKFNINEIKKKYQNINTIFVKP